MIILCRGLVRSEVGSHQMSPACPQICHLLAIFHHCVQWRDIVGREHTLKGLASALIELMSTYSHIAIYNICTGCLMMLLVLVINRHWARLPDGYGRKATPLQGSPDIINVLCVWQSNDPTNSAVRCSWNATFQHGKIAEFIAVIFGMFLFLCKRHRPKSPAHHSNKIEI